MTHYSNQLTFNQILLPLIVLFVGIHSCSQKKSDNHGLQLDSRYKHVQNISATAKCRGPQGSYTLVVKSSADGSCYFSQVYDFIQQPLYSQITSDNKGYIIDPKKNILDTLSREATELIRSHEFHKLHMNPNHFFKNIQLDTVISDDILRYQAIDRLENKAKLYFNQKEKHISKVEILNPIDTSQVIEIENKNWTDGKYGKMVNEIEIIQAKRDTFSFIFVDIKINE